MKELEELLTLVDIVSDTIACEFDISLLDVERITSILKDKIKEITNL